MVTKEYFNDKPRYPDFKSALEAMRRHAIDRNVSEISIPQIGCGLDGLNWGFVSRLIDEVFDDSGIQITVFIPTDFPSIKRSGQCYRNSGTSFESSFSRSGQEGDPRSKQHLRNNQPCSEQNDHFYKEEEAKHEFRSVQKQPNSSDDGNINQQFQQLNVSDGNPQKNTMPVDNVGHSGSETVRNWSKKTVRNNQPCREQSDPFEEEEKPKHKSKSVQKQPNSSDDGNVNQPFQQLTVSDGNPQTSTMPVHNAGHSDSETVRNRSKKTVRNKQSCREQSDPFEEEEKPKHESKSVQKQPNSSDDGNVNQIFQQLTVSDGNPQTSTIPVDNAGHSGSEKPQNDNSGEPMGRGRGRGRGRGQNDLNHPGGKKKRGGQKGK